MEDYEYMTKEEATKFFAEFYRGEHHIPKCEVKNWGTGWMVVHDRGGLSTFDYSDLTRLVFMSHRDCVRAEVIPHNTGRMKIAIWKRYGTEGDISLRHPTIEQALETFNSIKKS